MLIDAGYRKSWSIDQYNGLDVAAWCSPDNKPDVIIVGHDGGVYVYNQVEQTMTEHQSFLSTWQDDYHRATGLSGKILDVHGEMGRFGGLAIVVTVDEPNRGIVYYTPYLNPAPYDDCPLAQDDESNSCFGLSNNIHCEGHAFEDDPAAWLDSITSGTDFGQWDWGEGEETVPTF